MNRGITIAWKGKGNAAIPEILVTPEVSYSEQRRNFRKLRAQLTGYDELELWSSGQGRVKRYRFKSKVVAPEVPAQGKEKDTTVPEVSQSEASASSVTVTETVSGDQPVVPQAKAGKAKKPVKATKSSKTKK